MGRRAAGRRGETRVRRDTVQPVSLAHVVYTRDSAGKAVLYVDGKPDAYEVRFRTTVTSPNGEPALSSPGGDEAVPAVVGLRSPDGDQAVLYFSSGGAAKLEPGLLNAGFNTRWFNPRTGQWSSAKPDEHGDYVAPDEQDWALLINE
jgi:hypothetical protein